MWISYKTTAAWKEGLGRILPPTPVLWVTGNCQGAYGGKVPWKPQVRIPERDTALSTPAKWTRQRAEERGEPNSGANALRI